MKGSFYQKLIQDFEVGLAYLKIVREKKKKVDCIIFDINKEFEKIIGLRKKDIIGREAITHLPGYIWSRQVDILEDILGGVVKQSRCYIDSLGKWYQKTIYYQKKDMIIIVLSDISIQVESEEKLKEYETIYSNMNDGVFLIDVKENDFVFASLNDSYKNLKFNKDIKLIGKPLSGIFKNDHTETLITNLRKSIKEKNIVVYEEMLELPDGRRYLQNSLSPVFEGDSVVQIVGVSRDITDIRKVQERLNYLSYHDSLTGLYNRSYFENALKKYDLKKQLPISIIVGDVNGLKLTNDGFGHQEGDKILLTVTGILKKCCRKKDIIARWGGDEFMVLLPRTSENVTRRIVERMEKMINNLESDPIRISIAIGYAAKNEMDEDLERVIKNAEDWMYKKKLLESRNVHSNIIHSLKETLYQSSHENYDHCQRLKELSIKTGRSLALSEIEIIDLGLLAELHDLGKVAISNSIIEKEGELSVRERKTLNKHPEIGYQIAKSSLGINHISQYILHHHENWDGTGFPHKLRGEEIPFLSRIISIVNQFDKLTHYHPRMKTVAKEEAVDILKKQAGKKFDPDIVEVFVEKVISKKGDCEDGLEERDGKTDTNISKR